MATYEVEHNIPNGQDAPAQHQPARLPDLSTFFSALEQIDTRNVSNSNAVPTPVSIAAPFRMLADALSILERELDNGSNLLEQMRQQLMGDAEMPPREVQGVGQDFLDELDRVPKKSLKSGDSCPICNNAFLEDPYPLVVRLPCHKDHKFDLECIAPWLRLHATCPLDRKDLSKKKPPSPPPQDEEEDGEYDDYYA